MKEVSVGIDLGTTNSTISTCWPEGHPRLIRDENGSGIVPSVISFTETGEIIIGQKARQRMLTDMENTFYSIKRFIGRDMQRDDVKWAASQYPFVLECGPNGIPIAVTRGKKIPAYQLSGYVLKHLKEMAENSTGQPVQKAVITVPANFNESQRKATKQAGEFAGFEVMRIFNEPTAAALAYGLGKTEKEIVAVYDFGGGTFDITILRLEDPVFEVLSTAGDTMLGGDDIDRAILKDMLSKFEEEYGFSPSQNSRILQRFLFGAERMKCQLSDWIVTAFEDRHITTDDGKPLKPFNYELNREKFKNLTVKLAERSFDVCREAIRSAGIKISEVDKVVLVGGTTRIPYIRKMVEDFFGRPPLDKIQPDVVVSIGASIQAFSLAGGDMVFPAEEKELLPTLSKRDLYSEKNEQQMFEMQSLEPSQPSRTIEGMPGAVIPKPKPKPVPSIPLPVPVKEDKGDLIAGEPTQFFVKKSVPPSIPPSLPSADESGIPLEPDLPKVKDKKTLPFGEEPTNFFVRKSIPPLSPPPEEPEKPLESMFSLDVPNLKADLPVPVPLQQEMHKPLPNLDEIESLDHELKEEEEEGGAEEAVESVESEEAVEAEEVKELEEAEEVDDRDVEIPDIQVISPKKGFAAPTVTPESINQQYISGDVLKQMREQQHTRKMIETAGIASAGVSVSSAGRIPQEEERRAGLKAPVLLDVTPSTLGIETVGGFVEVIVKKNTPLPLEQAHVFTTSRDFQDRVVVRILEGESKIASENHELGVIELLDIRPAPRGEVKIEVTFDISVDGILEISAKNLETQTQQKARLTLFGT